MDHKTIVDARKKAEKAVEGMGDQSLKLKAFEQVFAKLLEAADNAKPAVTGEGGQATGRRARASQAASRPGTLTERLLILRDDSFFGTQRTLSEIREELASRGYHYPLTTLSGVMQKLVRDRELRRERVKTGKKKTYKYANA